MLTRPFLPPCSEIDGYNPVHICISHIPDECGKHQRCHPGIPHRVSVCGLIHYVTGGCRTGTAGQSNHVYVDTQFLGQVLCGELGVYVRRNTGSPREYPIDTVRWKVGIVFYLAFRHNYQW